MRASQSMCRDTGSVLPCCMHAWHTAPSLSMFRHANPLPARCMQGPLFETAPDFWRMVYERRVEVIVMLSRCRECDAATGEDAEMSTQYFPTKLGHTDFFGECLITLQSQVGARPLTGCSQNTQGPSPRFVRLFQ